jgi:hypothetical protein
MTVRLSKIESDIIRFLLVKDYGLRTPFLDQLAVATVASRRLTGVGCYIDLQIPKDIPAVDEIDAESSHGFETRLQPPRDSVGFTLFIRGGYLDWLEGYTFGDVPWPDKATRAWLILENAG